MKICKILLVFCVIVASPLVVACVEITDYGVSYEELRNLLESERKRADEEKLRADAVWQRVDEEKLRADAGWQRADEAERKLEQENDWRSRILAKCNDFSEIYSKALSLADSTSDAFVPHIRSLDKFPDDANAKGGEYLAITAASTHEEREKAAAELKKYQPKFRIANMSSNSEIDENSHAYQDRGKTNDIVFSYDFVWGIERLKNPEEALFAVTIVTAHEKDVVCTF
jgi:hypothetical protein